MLHRRGKKPGGLAAPLDSFARNVMMCARSPRGSSRRTYLLVTTFDPASSRSQQRCQDQLAASTDQAPAPSPRRPERWSRWPAPSLLRWGVHLAALLIGTLGLVVYSSDLSPQFLLGYAASSSAEDVTLVFDSVSQSEPLTPAVDAPVLYLQLAVPSGDNSEDTKRPQPLQIKDYLVSDGDTVNTIAQKFGITTESVLWSNDLSWPGALKAGQRLLLPPVSGLIYQVRPGDTVRGIAAAFSADALKIIEANGLVSPFVIQVDQRVVVPDGVKPQASQAPVLTQPSGAPSAGATDVARQARADNPPAPAATAQQAPTSPKPLPTATVAPTTVPTAVPTAAPRSPQEAFIASIGPGAQESQLGTGIPASVTVAQAILETYWGTSRLAKEANNFFGIKAREKPGSAGVVWMDTWEVIGGANVTRREPFRAYKSVADSFTDHGQFFLENSRYQRALAVKDDPRRFAQEVNRAGYATDPAYASKLITLMDRFDLYRFDVKLASSS